MPKRTVPFNQQRVPAKVPHFINTTTFAARDFRPRRGASDAHTLQGSVRREQRRLGQKEPPPVGLRRFSVLASLLLGHPDRSGRGMLPRRASPEPKIDATNVVVLMKWSTKGSKACSNADRFGGPAPRVWFPCASNYRGAHWSERAT